MPPLRVLFKWAAIIVVLTLLLIPGHPGHVRFRPLITRRVPAPPP